MKAIMRDARTDQMTGYVFTIFALVRNPPNAKNRATGKIALQLKENKARETSNGAVNGGALHRQVEPPIMPQGYKYGYVFLNRYWGECFCITG